MAFLSNVKISKKLPLIMISLALANAAIITVEGAYQSYNAQLRLSKSGLSSVVDGTVDKLDIYLGSIHDDVSGLSGNETVVEAIKTYKAAWSEIAATANPTTTLQKLYINDNPNPTGKKEELDYAKDGSTYSTAHARFHPWFRSYLRQRNYYDIFLFDAQGNLLYTVFKELDYATNLNTGQYKDSDLGVLFRDVKTAATSGSKKTIVFKDFKPYAPSYNAPASFIGAPVYDPTGTFIGVLAFQMPVERLNAMMQPDESLGDKTKIHLIGED